MCCVVQLVTFNIEIVFVICPWCALDIFLKVWSYSSGEHNNSLFLNTAGGKCDKTNFCVFYWELQGQCWFNRDVGSRALPRGIKDRDATRFFSWKFQFNQYESYTFGSKMAGNPWGLFLQRIHIILKQPLIAWERSFHDFENVEISENNQCFWDLHFKINARQWHFLLFWVLPC